MPQKNVVKSYIADGYYHVYNRGVEKRRIFEDDQDYKVFLKYLKESLTKPPEKEKLKTIFTLQGGTFKGVPRQSKNYYKEIDLIAYCLMPNHFHFLLRQENKNSMEKFLQTICVRYSMYFNKKHNRVGKLFQGHYKAALILEDNYLLHLSRYIHLNPLKYTKNIEGAYSSYQEYLKKRKTSWVKPETVLSFFDQKEYLNFENITSYKYFVEKYKDANELDLDNLVLDEE